MQLGTGTLFTLFAFKQSFFEESKNDKMRQKMTKNDKGNSTLICKNMKKAPMQLGTGTLFALFAFKQSLFEESKKRQNATKIDKKWQGHFNSYL